jgi:hypothetical protein
MRACQLLPDWYTIELSQIWGFADIHLPEYRGFDANNQNYF